jgi:spermidine/putrescine transport system substrate-binding protein
MGDPSLIRGLTQRRLSRRDLLVRGAAGALAISPLAAACGGGSAAPPPVKVGDPAWWRAQKPTGELVFANWPLYIDYRNWLKDRPTLNEFSRDSGVMVTYEEIIENNANFAEKITPLLRAGRPTGYDIVVLTNSWQLSQLIQGGLLVPLDHSQLGNFSRYASPLVKSPAYDPGNRYTVAWQSGFTGIAYDRRKTGRKITSIHDLWNPAFKGKVGMMTDLNDFGSAGLLYIGADVTNSTPDDWHQAGLALQAQKDQGIVGRYYDQHYIDALERGEIWISQAWSGDVFQARASGYPHLEFVVPEEGVMHWTDNMMIPMYASNPQSAMMWMDFYYQPEVAARVADWVNYITPVPDAQGVIQNQLHDAAVAQSPLVFPTTGISAHDYRVFRNQGEADTWNGIFGAIATNS